MDDDTPEPRRRPFGDLLFAKPTPIDWVAIGDCNGALAPEGSLRNMQLELGVMQEAEPHYRATGDLRMPKRRDGPSSI
jgi:hypothetical protein